MRGLSPVPGSWVHSHCGGTSSLLGGFSCCRPRALEHVLQQLWRKDIVAPQHGSLPGPRIEPVSPALAHRCSTGPLRSPARTPDSLLPPWPVYSSAEARGILPQPGVKLLTHPLLNQASYLIPKARAKQLIQGELLIKKPAWGVSLAALRVEKELEVVPGSVSAPRTENEGPQSSPCSPGRRTGGTVPRL